MKKGFTLVELLVVISIIGVLASLVLISFTGSQKQARDTGRKSDLKQYQAALENYANINRGLYPSRSTATGVPAETTLCTDLGMTGCSRDPRQTQDATFNYRYQSDGSGSGAASATTYVLWGKLENTSQYWVICSEGKVGTRPQAGWTNPSMGGCPL
ncbi:hypothetical protein A2630_03325 [Candidatus Woesebacteria bacterium RIFCSPHIGHO2_01_FULL_44_10]|uniref:Type II secretion system protein GspG C-terminal domain-containing protein n=1 Tax=Candidatus Woesebacteria bacterium RIFCSPLOWO2_01_FULL_44_14 TaxID=1802525 RepID=A0A1F8BXL5_9BACT|nr:MAG: hypothetical protein A2630_03325 [Candidatus Woesebacteria bacterium RIFCSPHIGHO2_01_FULL_44_10]OGM56442.1 MAG: hypothetical protein A3F62_01985 [Candidatus Woesebacteria bacterium RIFCSPHIGHO2_12_FULL_44_11]OGM68843.1 MAG: hypothetical protein A2975_00530 [Candidatus Woesebacteria bacterium RIFCSPLOWO2_01_FULL_44_14]